MSRYKLKVRGTRYLWGGAGMTLNVAWPLLLTVRIDDLGESLTLATDSWAGNTAPPVVSTIGTLHAGETYTIPLIGLRGVMATCALDTNVVCSLTPLAVRPPSQSSSS